MRKLSYALILLAVLTGCSGKVSTIRFDGNVNSRENASPQAQQLIEKLAAHKGKKEIVVKFPKGEYHFYEEGSFEREYYISNHDQDNPKQVAFALENLKNITIDGQGSEFIFHGRMVPFALINCENIQLKNFSIDFELPALRQLQILEADTAANEATAVIHPAGNYRIDDNRLVVLGEGYELTPEVAMAFAPNRNLAYQRSDVSFNPQSIEELAPDTLLLKNWYQIPLTSPGERFALRSYYRPTPGIFVSECLNTELENVTVHYAEGMGLLVQMSENITLDGFSVCLRGDDDPRYFTTQADATHFSACKGKIISKNGLYEGMADDAINVHGTYLRITRRVDDRTLQARYMHPQAWGFKWGEPGDSVQFVESEMMELVGDNFITGIESIRAIDKESEFGAKEFEIVFTDELPVVISESGKFGVENLSWTPEVVFSNNLIRNNRARGALFSTPQAVVCEDNVFDHTHGTAILLCGDCNGWYETGACKDVTIRNNVFINALTSYYQFTNAIISIYPEIPNLSGQEKLFHSGILIENNTFETFDRPLVYAKSTDGLIFRNNKITAGSGFEAFHWNKHPFLLEKVNNVVLEGNEFFYPFDPENDIRVNDSPDNAVELR